MVGLLYRPARQGIPTVKESGYPNEGLGVIILAKQRNGKTDRVYFGHYRTMTNIGDYMPPEEYLR